MAQRDYILRMFEEMSRVLAQIIYHQQIKDYAAAHDLLDEQLKQTLGMSSDFLHSLSDETLLAMLTTLDTLNVEKCWLVATLLKAEGDLFADEKDEDRSYYSYLKACNLFLEALHEQHLNKEIEPVPEIEELYEKLNEYELPLRTQQLFFWYFEYTGKYNQAVDLLFEVLESASTDESENIEELEEILKEGEAFYTRLLGKSDASLEIAHLSRDEISEGVTRLHQFSL